MNAKLNDALIILVLVICFGILFSYKSKIYECFVENQQKIFKNNKFKQVILPKVDNYDIEIGIPSGQILYNTVQGNWGISVDSVGQGTSFGVYRDGYTADGSIFKGKSGKRYKRLLEQGPYAIKYKVRKNKKNGHDVTILVNGKVVDKALNEGVSSDKLQYIGTNYNDYNNLTKSKKQGRRKVDYIKFIPIEIPKKIETMENMDKSDDDNKDEFCPANCKPTLNITGNCSKEVISKKDINDETRNVYYRKCAHTCLSPMDNEYVNYDKSGIQPDGSVISYDVKRDGCRNSNQCSGCPLTEVEVNSEGKDLNPKQMNREDVDIRVEMLKNFPENYSLTKIEDDDKDNRLGGDGSIYEKNKNSYIYEKTREMDKKNYEKDGPAWFDSIWTFG